MNDQLIATRTLRNPRGDSSVRLEAIDSGDVLRRVEDNKDLIKTWLSTLNHELASEPKKLKIAQLKGLINSRPELGSMDQFKTWLDRNGHRKSAKRMHYVDYICCKIDH